MPRISWYRGYGPFLIYFIMITGLIVSAILALIGTAVGVGVNYSQQEKANQANAAAQEAANQANIQMQESANQTNIQLAKEQMNFQGAQSEKAYQRSTAKNQIRELIAAGYTEQQAKQIVAGSGSAASYTPAAGALASVNPAVVNPLLRNVQQLDVNSLSTALGNFGNAIGSLGDDVMKDDGGAIGYIESSRAMSILSPHISDIPKFALTSPHSLQSWLKNSDFDWVKLNQDVFRSVYSSPRALRSLMHQLSLMTDSFSNGAIYAHNQNQLTKDKFEIQHQQLVNDLTDMEIVAKGFNNAMLEIQCDDYPIISRAAVLGAEAQIQALQLDKVIKDDPQYKIAHKLRLLAEEDSGSLIAAAAGTEAKLKSKTLTERIKFYDDPSNSFMVTYLHEMKEAGMTNSDIGALLSFMGACGVKVPQYLRNLGDALDVVVDDNLDTQQKLLDLLKNKTNLTQEEKLELVNKVVTELQVVHGLGNPVELFNLVLRSVVIPKFLELIVD